MKVEHGMEIEQWMKVEHWMKVRERKVSWPVNES